MSTIKAYTDLSQSRTLSKILPLESADMRFCFSHTLDGRITGHYPMIGNEPSLGTVPCWSLAALLSVLPESYQLTSNKEGKVQLMLIHQLEKDYYDNPVDACVVMIERLHELNLM
jgi:hypothetical protein